jgi:hypothetical protein
MSLNILSYTGQLATVKNDEAGCQWLTPVILVTWEAKIGRIAVQG